MFPVYQGDFHTDDRRCPGKQLLGKGGDNSEDCMTVNVFRQKRVGDEKLPVAVYIHGGAFNRGSCKFTLLSQLLELF